MYLFRDGWIVYCLLMAGPALFFNCFFLAILLASLVLLLYLIGHLIYVVERTISRFKKYVSIDVFSNTYILALFDTLRLKFFRLEMLLHI